MEIRLHKNAKTTPKIREYIKHSKKSNVELSQELGIHVNGPEFTDRFMNEMKDKELNKPSGKHEFDKLCNEMEIDRRYSKPFKPQTNGMVERFNRRVKDWLKQKHKYIKSFQDIKEYVDNMVNNYNNTKLRVLDYHTPLQILCKHNHEAQNTQGARE